MPLALHALRLLLASRCLTSPIRSPPPPSPVCMTTNRIKPSPATGTASRQSKRHRPGSRNRSHHQSCRVGTSSPTEQIATAAVGLDSGHPKDPRRRLAPKTSFPHHPLCFPHLTMISRALECQQRKASAVTTSASSASTLPPEGTAATRRCSWSPSQEVPVRALHVPRSARAVAALPSDLGEIPMPRAFRFAASGHFPWSVDRSRVE